MSLLKRVTNYDNPRSLGSKLRKKRAAKVKTLISKIHSENGACHILDVGGGSQYWKMFDAGFLEQNSVHITLTNIDYEFVMDPDFDRRNFTVDSGDARNLPYPDNSFHLVHSNSVVEHVGDWPNMLAFAKEIRRLAPRYYIQTPYFWFPYEPHFGAPFFHWLPESVRISLLLRRTMGHFPPADSVSRAVEWTQSVRLLDHQQFSCLFPDATVLFEKFAGLPKSLIAIRDPSGPEHGC